jgi:hypothetical protein
MRKFGQPKDLKKFKLPPQLTYAGGRVAEAPPAPELIERFTGDADKFSVTGYMCAIDWEHEIGNAPKGSAIYPSIEALKRKHDCWEECGIVEVEVTIKKTIAPGQY